MSATSPIFIEKEPTIIEKTTNETIEKLKL